MEIFAFIVIVLIIWALFGIRIIRSQEIAIVERFGKYSGTLEAGLNWIPPFPISKIVHVADLRIIEIKSMVEIKTSDNAFVAMPTSLMLRVSAEKVIDSYYKLDNPYQQLNRWVLNSVRSIAAAMKLNELFEDREMIVSSVARDLESKASEFGFIIETVLIEQPSVSEEVQRASNRVVASQRELEAAQQEAQAQRVRIVESARAEAEGQIERAKGLAESRHILAQSFQNNISTITQSGADIESVTNLLLTVNRLDAMRDIGNTGNLIIMDTQQPQMAMQSKIVELLQDKK